MPKITGKIYKIPIWERFLSTSPFVCRIIIMHVDEVGLLVEVGHDTPTLTTDYLRHHLTGRRHVYALIEAKDVEEALNTFYEKYEGARTGGEIPESRAQWVDEHEPILEMPSCDMMHRNSDGQFTCGVVINETPDHFLYEDNSANNSGDNGMCVIDGYDEPFDMCPVHQFYKKLSKTYDTVRDPEFGLKHPIYLHLIKGQGLAPTVRTDD